MLNPAIYGRVFAIAGNAPTLAGATTVSASQLGISSTPVLAAAALTEGASLTWVCLIGAVLAATAVPLIVIDHARPDDNAAGAVFDKTAATDVDH